MKKWSLILALFLCIIAVGGLVVIFRTEKESAPLGNDSSGGSSYSGEVEGVELNESNLIY